MLAHAYLVLAMINERSMMSSGSVTSDLRNSREATRFDRCLLKILDHATAVFYEKGCEGASMRDLSRVTGLSAGWTLLLFRIQRRVALPD